jgi:hypothetical protein
LFDLPGVFGTTEFLIIANQYNFYKIVKHFEQIPVIYEMKKVASILLVFLMIAALLHISVATHYCGGREVSSKISMTGKLANCGMESSEKKLPLPGTNVNNHCCDDVVTFCGIDSNFAPSFSLITESYNYNFQIVCIPSGNPVNSPEVSKSQYTNIIPPGALMSTNVDLSNICVFRI